MSSRGAIKEIAQRPLSCPMSARAAATPLAFFCGNDKIAMKCYTALAALGMRVPDDVAVIGYDSIRHTAEGLLPALTAMQLPHYELGKWAAQYLIENQGSDRGVSPHLLDISFNILMVFRQPDATQEIR